MPETTPTPATPAPDKLVIADGENRIRDEFGPHAHHRGDVLLTKTTAYRADCASKRPITEIQAFADDIEQKVFKGRCGNTPAVYEPTTPYRVGLTRTHLLARYDPTDKTIYVREYCGLPCFPETVLKVSLYSAKLAAYAHLGTPTSKLFEEHEDEEARGRFVKWFAEKLAERTPDLFGADALREYRDFRRAFMPWAVQHLKPAPAPA